MAKQPDHYVFHGYQLVTLDWCCWAAATIFVALRLYVRIHLRTGFSWHIKDWWRWADFWIFLAWLCFLYTCISDSLKNHWHVYGNGYESRELRITIQRVLIADSAVYFTCMYAIKGAMLAFFMEIVPRQAECRKLWVTLRVTAAFCGICWAYSLLALFFGCFPLHHMFNDPNFAYCNVQYFFNYIQAQSTFPLHILTDAIVYTLPFWIIRLVSGTWTRTQTAGVLVLFLLGFLSTMCTVLNFALMFRQNFSHVVQAIRYICTPVEETTGLLVACSPAFKFLVVRIGKDRKLSWGSVLPSKVVSWRKASTSTEKDSGVNEDIEKVADVGVQVFMVNSNGELAK